MPVRVHNFLGSLGWNARKYLPGLASESYLKLQFVSRRKLQKNYIEYFMSRKEVPHPLVEASRGTFGVYIESKGEKTPWTRK